MFDTPNKICPVCGKPWDHQLKTGYNEDHTRFCAHDNEFIFSGSGEVTTNKIRQDRKTFEKDILQPFKRDGTPNEKFKKAYGSDNKAYKNLGNKKSIFE